MQTDHLHIKNMVCRRCVMTVEDICHNLGIRDAKVSLGEVQFNTAPDEETLKKFYERLRKVGFEPIKSNEMVVLEKVKVLVRNYARNASAKSVNLSSFIEDSIHIDFRYVSRLFSSLEGRTIQKYLMLQRVEYVKELLLDDDMTLAAIADAAGFSSVAHLSASFKKTIGITISDFKTNGSRIPLDEV